MCKCQWSHVVNSVHIYVSAHLWKLFCDLGRLLGFRLNFGWNTVTFFKLLLISKRKKFLTEIFLNAKSMFYIFRTRDSLEIYNWCRWKWYLLCALLVYENKRRQGILMWFITLGMHSNYSTSKFFKSGWFTQGSGMVHSGVHSYVLKSCVLPLLG